MGRVSVVSRSVWGGMGVSSVKLLWELQSMEYEVQVSLLG
jgi:hypothetical protein